MSDDFSNDYEKRENYDYNTDPYRDAPKKGNGCCSGCGCGCLLLILALLIGGFLVHRICIKGVPLHVSLETTIITEPLKGDGKTVDFFPVIKEKVEPKIPAGENGFKAVLEAYGKAMFEPKLNVTRDWQYEETCKLFGLDPALKPTCVYESPHDYLVLAKEIETGKPEAPKPEEEGEAEDEAPAAEATEKESNVAHVEIPFERFISRPWTLDEQPKMKEWLEKVGPGLDIVQQSAMKEHYFLPMVRRNEKELCLLSQSMEAYAFHARLSEGLRLRAMNRLATGDAENAWKDIVASLRLYRQVMAGNDIIASFDGQVGTTRLLPELSDTLIRYDRWTPEQLARGIADLEKLPAWPKNEDVVEEARFLLLDAVSSASDMRSLLESFSSAPVEEEVVRMLEIFGFNWNLVAIKLNAEFDKLKRDIDGKSDEEIKNLFGEDLQSKLEREMHIRHSAMTGGDIFGLFTVDGRSQFFGEMVGVLMTMTAGRLLAEEIDETVRCRLLRAALALEKHKLEKKAYPDSLDALELKSLEPEITIQYEKTETGYVLSVGDIKIER